VQGCVLRHLATGLWDHDQDDQIFVAGLPADVARSCLSYFQWQREYTRLTARGLDDTRVRNILGGFEKEPEQAEESLCPRL
jgi:hypothetical protein